MPAGLEVCDKITNVERIRGGRSVGSTGDRGQESCSCCFVDDLGMRLRDWAWKNRGKCDDLHSAYLVHFTGVSCGLFGG